MLAGCGGQVRPPGSCVAILAGMTTLIGTSTNLLVSGVLTQLGEAPLEFFEMTVPQGTYEPPYMKDSIRIADDGYVYAPTKPGLGYEIDRDELDNATRRVES